MAPADADLPEHAGSHEPVHGLARGLKRSVDQRGRGRRGEHGRGGQLLDEQARCRIAARMAGPLDSGRLQSAHLLLETAGVLRGVEEPWQEGRRCRPTTARGRQEGRTEPAPGPGSMSRACALSSIRYTAKNAALTGRLISTAASPRWIAASPRWIAVSSRPTSVSPRRWPPCRPASRRPGTTAGGSWRSSTNTARRSPACKGSWSGRTNRSVSPWACRASLRRSGSP